MSILIKGMKMPTSCLKGGCPLDGFACQLWEDKYWSRVESPYKMRHKNCPLIELPDHGDLIDRDAFIKVNREYLCKDCERRKGVKNGRKRTLYEIGGVPCRACGVEDMFEYLDDAPVFIPAERREE